MSYAVEGDKVLWKGRAVKGADAASFEILASIIGRDAGSVYVLGKAAKVDAASFEILSASYARDAATVFYIMETKLKPLKQADAASFEAVGDCHGRDATHAFVRDKRMRLSKQGSLEAFRSLGFVYSTDGAFLFFGNDRIHPPTDVDLSKVRLKWFDDNTINIGALALSDGETSWLLPRGRWEPEHWMALPDGDFETLRPFVSERHHWLDRTGYAADATHIWYEGRRIEGVSAKTARMIGQDIFEDQGRLWWNGEPMDVAPSDVTFVTHAASRIGERWFRGDALHHGDRIIVYDAAEGETVFENELGAPDNLNAAVRAALKPLFQETALVLDNFRPIHWNASDISARQDPDAAWPPGDPIPAPDMPDYDLSVSEAGEAVLTLPCGTVLRRPLSAWFTLGCDLWCHMRGVPAEYVPYIYVGAMLPRGDAMHIHLARQNEQAMWAMTGAAYRAGHEQEARQLAHLLLWEAMRHKSIENKLGRLAGLPAALMDELHFQQKHYDFSATTNLAAARVIVDGDYLADADPRVRVEMCGVLTGTTISTNKRTYFLKEIAPYVMQRYAGETVAAVRERMAAVLEAMLIGGQVDCEVSQKFHHAEMLPVIEFCIDNGIHTRFNRARLAEAYWALNRGKEGDAVAEALIADVGEGWTMPGVYCNRPMFRGPRLWFLRGKLDVAWRKSKPEAHKARLAALEAEYEALKARYGADWHGDDVEAVASDLQRYKEGVAQL